MFHAFVKVVGGRRGYRYFKTWDGAKNAMDKDIQEAEKYGWELGRKWDYFNSSKGFYVYEQEGKTDEGEAVTWAVVDLYFED